MARNKKRLFLSVLIGVAVAVSGALWLHSLAHRMRTHSSAVSQTPSAAPPEQTKRPAFKPDPLTPSGGRLNLIDARAVFINQDASVGRRFSELAEMAEKGDLNAKHFALQIANDCAALNKVPDDQPPIGQAKATPYQMQLRGEMKAECAEVTSDPAFSKFNSILNSYPADVYDGSMKLTIRQEFANRGPDAAINAAVSAISQRPDESTVDMTADELANLDISSIYLQPALSSIDSVNPIQRNQLMRFALNLLACSYGRPCGPNSFVVQSTCTELGACIPGADLQGVYRAQLLSGQQMTDVLSLLAYLQQIQPTFTWQ